MFCRYDYTNFPEVRVIFNGIILNENDFALLTEQWKQLYEDKKEFTFVFDVEDMGLNNPYWAYRVASFISDMKKYPIHYLQSSKIINVSTFVRYLLHIVFSIQSPISPVTIVDNDGTETLINP